MKEKSSGTTEGFLGLVLLFAAIAYFTLGGFNGFFGIFILGMLFGLSCLIGLIPFIGFAVQAPVMLLVIQPWVLALAGIHTCSLTWILFGLCVALGILCTVITSLLVIKLISRG